MDEIHVGSLMNLSVVTTDTDTRLPELVHLIRDNQVSCLVVVDGNRPVGVVTERDLVRALEGLLNEQYSKTMTAADVMHTPPVTVEQHKPLFDALVLAQSHNTTTLIVVNREEMLCGIVSHADMARAYKQIIEQQRQVIENGADVDTDALRDVNDQLKSLSTEDALLGIGNRRSMEVDLAYTHQCARRYERPYSLVIYDLDCFDYYNRQYGRSAGDDALKLVVEHIRHSIRKADRLYRYGGAQLLLLLPETAYEGACMLAERIAQELAERNIPHAKNPVGVLTLSGGVAGFDPAAPGEADWQTVVDQAAARLREAKSSGRNCIGGVFTSKRAEDAPSPDPV